MEKDYLYMVNLNGLDLKLVPNEYITEEHCLKAVSQNSKALIYVPKDLLTENVCNASVSEISWEVEYNEAAMMTVKKNGLMLQFIEHQTYDICMAAINQNIRALQYVKHLTSEIYRAVVKIADDKVLNHDNIWLHNYINGSF